MTKRYVINIPVTLINPNCHTEVQSSFLQLDVHGHDPNDATLALTDILQTLVLRTQDPF